MITCGIESWLICVQLWGVSIIHGGNNPNNNSSRQEN